MRNLILPALLLISVSTFAQKFKLALNLKKDSTYYLNSSSNLTIIQDIPGQKQTIELIIGGRVAHKVIAIKDSVYEMEVKYTGINVGMKMGVMSMVMNSAGNSSNAMLDKLMKAMVNVPFSMSITRSGKVLSVTGMEKLYAGMGASIPQATEAQKAQFRSQVEQSFGEKSIKSNFQDAFAVLPKKDVAVNDKWSALTVLESSGLGANVNNTYALTAVSDDAYMIHGDAVVSPLSNGGGYRQTNGIQMRYTNIKGKGTTEMRLDKNTCWLVDEKVSKSIDGIADIKDSPKTPGGIKFPMSVIGDITTSGK